MNEYTELMYCLDALYSNAYGAALRLDMLSSTPELTKAQTAIADAVARIQDAQSEMKHYYLEAA